MKKNEPGWALVRAASGGHSFGTRFSVFRNPYLSELIQAVDQFQGTVTEETIRSLAIRYGDEEKMVKHLFQTKKERREAQSTKRISFHQAEIDLVERLHNEGKPVTKIAKELNSLDINRKRGVSRTTRSVKAILLCAKKEEKT